MTIRYIALCIDLNNRQLTLEEREYVLRGCEEVRPDDNQAVCTINELLYYVFTEEGLLIVEHIKVLNVWLHRRPALFTPRHVLDLTF